MTQQSQPTDYELINRNPLKLKLLDAVGLSERIKAAMFYRATNNASVVSVEELQLRILSVIHLYSLMNMKPISTAKLNRYFGRKASIFETTVKSLIEALAVRGEVAMFDVNGTMMPFSSALWDELVALNEASREGLTTSELEHQIVENYNK